MKPAMSSCLIFASLWSAAIERTCPWSVYSWRSGALHAAATNASTQTRRMLRRMLLIILAMIWIVTSSYNYPEWKGSFYPEKLPAAKMLPYYAERFPTVEINYTFYRSPNEKILEGWHKPRPGGFKLTLKSPKRITHDRRLRECGELVRQFVETAATLQT